MVKKVTVKIKKKDIRPAIKRLDSNITGVVSRADGSLEIYVKKQSYKTKLKVMKHLNSKNLTWSFTKIYFIEVGK